MPHARKRTTISERGKKRERKEKIVARKAKEIAKRSIDRGRAARCIPRGVPLSTLRAIIIHYATRASREIARGSARVRVLVRGLVELQIQVGGGEETREDRATGGWPGSRTR